MLIELKSNAEEDLEFFRKKDPKKLERIFDLIEDIQKNPTTGLGKPEKLKHGLSGCWSRRIDRVNRLVYKIEKNKIIILNCRYHYSR